MKYQDYITMYNLHEKYNSHDLIREKNNKDIWGCQCGLVSKWFRVYDNIHTPDQIAAIHKINSKFLWKDISYHVSFDTWYKVYKIYIEAGDKESADHIKEGHISTQFAFTTGDIELIQFKLLQNEIGLIPEMMEVICKYPPYTFKFSKKFFDGIKEEYTDKIKDKVILI